MLERLRNLLKWFLTVMLVCGIFFDELDLATLFKQCLLRERSGTLRIGEQETLFLHQLIRELSQFAGNASATEIWVHCEDE